MGINFFEGIKTKKPDAFNRMCGYNDQEIEKIERLYNIVAKGDFRDFLRRAGRCDGGVIGDDPLVIYRSSWGIRGQILFQLSFHNDLQDLEKWDFLNKPFVFSLESETQYYFFANRIG